MHALIENGSIIRVGARPDWRDGDTGAPLTKEQWLAHGWLPVIDEETDHDPATHYLVARPSSDWIVALPGWVFRTFDVIALPPQPEPEPEPVFVYKLDLFERTTNAEAEAILAAMDAQPARIRMIFNAAQSFREDHELWPLLTGAATEMFGAERAGELLAPSAL